MSSACGRAAVFWKTLPKRPIAHARKGQKSMVFQVQAEPPVQHLVAPLCWWKPSNRVCLSHFADARCVPTQSRVIVWVIRVPPQLPKARQVAFVGAPSLTLIGNGRGGALQHERACAMPRAPARVRYVQNGAGCAAGVAAARFLERRARGLRQPCRARSAHARA